jgi:hypothetical protein
MRDFDRGIVDAPYRRLLASALERYGSHPTFLDLGERYLTPSRPPVGLPGAPGQYYRSAL